MKLSDHEARQSNLIDVMVLLSQNLSFHERDRGGDPGPVSSVRYVRPPLVKSEPVDRREHGHPKWIRLKSAGNKEKQKQISFSDAASLFTVR